MKLPISHRLLACAGFVRKGARIADVGCDHGYLSIHLLREGIAAGAICSDVRQQPLQSARRNAQKYGLQDKMEFYLSDGVQSIPQNFDTLICAGMGADTIVSILEAAPWLRSSSYRLILQCQSKTPMLRKYLSDAGFSIVREAVLRDGRFLYTVMEVIFDPEQPRLTPAQCYLPAVLSGQEVSAYRQWVIGGLKIAAEHQTDGQKKEILRDLEDTYDYSE
ncbi:MAG: SAM-dependent methyltransferase [Oscillospiraceae bacterium]|nr:SAM-dependent methyltransferase [Oscillospiraceae bacterium]MBQ9930279.1 SAM-dependent methyltransferase [Oscillospiraceae bacterium]